MGKKSCPLIRCGLAWRLLSRFDAGMEFIQGRVQFENGDTQGVALIAELLETLNSCARRAFSQSISQNVQPKAMNEVWASKNDIYGTWNTFGSLNPASLTFHQRDMIVRHASNLRKAAHARSEYLAGHLKGLADACFKSIVKKRQDLAGLKKELKAVDGSGKPLLRPEASKKKRERARFVQQGVDMSEARRQRLLAAASRHAALAKSGLASTCFGSRKLASQVHDLESPDSTFKSKEEWSNEWRESRNGSWLFEGDKGAASGNRAIKWDEQTGLLRIRLTEDQALRRMEAYAKEHEVDLHDLMHGPASKFGSIRKKCDYLEVPLNFDGQDKKLANVIRALTPIENEGAKGTQPCKAPVSWRIWIEGDPNTPKSCKVYARAQWKEAEVDLLSFPNNGCLGLDINAWGISTAWCNPEGNKPSKGYGAYIHDVKIDWKDKSTNQTLHAIRNAVKEIVDGCARLGSVLAIEALDFSDKKKNLRYEDPKRASQLSGFAYQKLIEAIEARARKVGVEVRKVDPAYTSVVGWAKYGSKMGLNPDQAAAFAIARRGVLSKGEAVKRRKIKGDWIDLYAKKESLREFEVQETNEVKSEESKTKKAQRRSGQQSMSTSKASSESNLARALGGDRRQWAGKLAGLRIVSIKGKILLREEISAHENGPAAKDSKGTSHPLKLMKEEKRGSRHASTLL